MQKLSNFTGQARHGWEKMTPAAFGMGRPHDNLPLQQQQKRSMPPTPMSPLTPTDSVVTLSFNVPFASNLNGPEPEEVLHASPGALLKWTHPEGVESGTPTHKLPVHSYHEEHLRQLCKGLSENSGGRLEAAVTSSEPQPTPASQRLPRKGLVTNVCVTGESELVHKMRAKILNETPIALVHKSVYNAEMPLLTYARNVPLSMWTPNSSSTLRWTASSQQCSSISTSLPNTLGVTSSS